MDSPRFWERQPGEIQVAYAAFCHYRDLGQGHRSTRRVAQELSKSSSIVRRWSSRHDWVARVNAYDDFLQMEREDAVREAEREAARNLVEARQQVQRRIVAAERRFLDRVEQMLEWEPFFTQEVVESYDDGRARVIVNKYPSKWTYATLVAAFRVLDDSPSTRAMDAITEEHQWGEDSASIHARAAAYFEQLGEEVRERALNGEVE